MSSNLFSGTPPTVETPEIPGTAETSQINQPIQLTVNVDADGQTDRKSSSTSVLSKFKASFIPVTLGAAATGFLAGSLFAGGLALRHKRRRRKAEASVAELLVKIAPETQL